MGLLSILKKLKSREHSMRVLLVGLDAAGKTTICKRLRGDDINTVSPTLGFNIETMEYNNQYTLHLWDIGGQSSLRSYWRNYYEHTDGVVWCVDSADVRRLADCKFELHRLLQSEKLAGATLLIYANKCDLPGAVSVSDISQLLDIDGIQNRHVEIIQSSAVTGKGVHEGIQWLVNDIASRIYFIQ